MDLKPQKDAPSRYLHLRGSKKPKSNIIAVGGGKGGVGKSFMSTSMALFLSQMGHRTILVDLDFGAANLHTYLGLSTPKIGLMDFLADPHMKLQQVQTRTDFHNLTLITSASDSLDLPNPSEADRSRLMSSLYSLEADYVILDLSAGTSIATLDFFLMASQQIIVMTPDPISVENAYRFIKSAFFRRVKRFEFQLNLQDEISMIMSRKDELGVRSPGDLLHYLKKKDPERGGELHKLMQDFKIQLILNQGRSPKDMELAPAVESVCKKYFGIDCSLLGMVEYDNAVWQALRRRKHLLVECPHSRLYTQLMSLSRALTIHSPAKKAVV
jgi:flagellar biosynthesis protein FlhG